jgi:hypothetical protein
VLAEASGQFSPDWLKKCEKKRWLLSVAASATPRTLTESEMTFNRDCIHGNACAGRQLVLVFANHRDKRYESLSIQ